MRVRVTRMYDLLIKGGQVYDGSGGEPRVAEVSGQCVFL